MLKESFQPEVAIIMGSESDYDIMSGAATVLKDFDISYEITVVSAHRTPMRLFDYATSAEKRNIQIIIAGAGGAAHLPGMTASLTILPVIGVPIPTKHLQGLDSLFSIVQMPSGIPVATVSIGGAKNAGLLAVRILARGNPELTKKLHDFEEKMRTQVKDMALRVEAGTQ